MKKIHFLITILLLILFFSCEDHEEPTKQESIKKQTITCDEITIYIPTDEEIGTFFVTYNFLLDLENGKIPVEKENLIRLYDTYVNGDMLDSYLVEAYFRQTKNNKIKKYLIEYIGQKNLDDEYSLSLLRLYKSKIVKYQQDDRELIQYNYNDEYFDENINLFLQDEILTFSKELGMVLFDNDWSKMSYQSDDEEFEDYDSFSLLFGGGTNSMSINLRVNENIDLQDFESEVVRFDNNKYENWTVRELALEGVLKRAGADKIYFGMGYGDDVFEAIKAGTFSIYLFNEHMQKAFTVSYYMNFSKINNNFKVRHRIWNYLAFHVMLTFINIQEYDAT
ncbi:MAG: hypothetical protein JW822_09355 [Spirochaetales bacterium]|nr:hypothetical protein [Spirochaetales bacterium]